MDLDGLGLSKEQEDKVNRLAHACLGSQQGKEFIAYLRNVTINRPLPAGTDVNSLLHMEGQRWIVGLIQKRQQLGERAPDELDHVKPTTRKDTPRPSGRGRRRKSGDK